MNKAERHRVKMLRYFRRLRNLGLSKFAGEQWTNCYREQGKPCSCSMCSRGHHGDSHSTKRRSLAAIVFAATMLQATAQDTIPYPAYPYLGLNHSAPPVVNIVGAGMNLEGAAKDRRTGLWIALAGGALAAGMATNEDMADSPGPLVIGALTAVFSLSFTLSGLKWEDRAGDLLQCGYSPQYLYESVPDSVGSDPPKRFTLPAMIDNTPIRIPARFK